MQNAIYDKTVRLSSLLIAFTFLAYGNATIFLEMNPLSDLLPFNITGIAYLIASLLHHKLKSKACVASLILGALLIPSIDSSEFAKLLSFQSPRLIIEATAIYSLLILNVTFSVFVLITARRRSRMN